MEQKEFETLIRQIRPKLHTEALRLLTDSDEAEDVTQEAVLKLWTIREQLEAYRSVEALAVVMVRRLALSRKRTCILQKNKIDVSTFRHFCISVKTRFIPVYIN